MATTAPPVQTSSWWEPIKDALSKAYQGILNFVKSPFDGLATVTAQKQNPHQQKLLALRQKHYDLIKKESAKANPDYNAVTSLITQDTKKYIQEIIAQEMKKLGTPPCKMAFFTEGSMARKESGPVTDLEIGLLISEKSVAATEYAYKLVQNLSDTFFMIGEHPDIGGKGLRMDEADNSPPHMRFFARNATNGEARDLLMDAVTNKAWDKIPFEGSRAYLATPEDFAEYSQPVFVQDKAKLNREKEETRKKEWQKAIKDPKNAKKIKTAEGKRELESHINYWLDKIYRSFNTRELRTANDAGKKLGRNMEFLHGDQGVYQKFIKRREDIFAQKAANGLTGRQNIGKEKMRDDIDEQLKKGKNVYVTGKLAETIDIKRELYRFTEQFLTNLGFYHHCKSQNTIEIAKELVDRGILSKSFGGRIVDFIQLATGLRLKEQSILKRQGFALYLDQKEFNKDKEKMEKEISDLKSGIQYMESVAGANKDHAKIAAHKRDLFKLEHKYEHLLDMAPGKILSAADIQKLSQHMPVAQEIFAQAQAWTRGTAKLGFGPVHKGFDQKMEDALDFVKHNPSGFFVAFNNLKKQKITPAQQTAFIAQCEKENLLKGTDKVKLRALKFFK